MQQDLRYNRPLYYPIRSDQYARMGHRIITLQNQILIFGGLTAQGEYNPTIIKINCETMTLDLVHTLNPFRLQGFSLFCHSGRVYIWGGSGPAKDDQKSASCKNKLLEFVGNDFLKVQQKGRVPAPRESHSSCLVSNKYLIIMGGNNGHAFFNDWHILDLTSMAWSKLQPSDHLPPFLDTQLIWYGGRGFLITGESFNATKRTMHNENQLFEFRFLNFKERKLQISPIHVSEDAKQKHPRGSPIAVLVQLDNPYIVLLGGTLKTTHDPLALCPFVQIFNIQTLEWFSIECVMKTGFGFEALFSGEKIYLVGGLNKNKQVSQFVEYIEFKTNFMETKVCKVCREVYGLKHLHPLDSNLTIKFESETTPKTFISADIIGRLASYISYPFSAFGLLLDNSLNLSGTDIDIEFMLVGDTEERREYKRVRGLQELNYDFIQIIDNSMGFTQHEITQSLCSFALKTEKLTGDKRYEEDVEIKRQYGLNLNLGALRLGKSCLYITKTEDRSRLIAFFSATPEYERSPFTVSSYIISAEGQCSSSMTRDMVKQSTKGKIPPNYETVSGSTIIYIFDIQRQELSLKRQKNNQIIVNYALSPFKVFRFLNSYIESLYLKPKVGRRIAVNKQEIKYLSYLQIFKKDESGEKIVEVGPREINQEVFKYCKIYRIVSKDYFLQNILCYHKNRLLFALQGNSQFCGVIELVEKIQIDICKTKIQNKSDELIILRFIHNIFQSQTDKRYPILATSRTGASEPLSKKTIKQN